MHWIGRTVILLALLVIGLAIALPRISSSSDASHYVGDVVSAPASEVPPPPRVSPLPAAAPGSDDNQSPSRLENDLTRSLDGMIQSHGEVFQDAESGLRDRLEQADQRLSSIKSEIQRALRNANRQIRLPGQPSPTVLLLLLEGVTKADLGFYGEAGRTPLLEGIAERAMVFDVCYSGPTPEVARYMLLTGQGHNAGAKRYNGLAKMMWESGYHTVLLETSNWLQPTERQAFDQHIAVRAPAGQRYPPEIMLNGSVAKVVANDNEDPDDNLTANQLLLEQARHFTSSAPGDSQRPKFIQLHLTIDEPHHDARRRAIDELDVMLGRWIHSLEVAEEGPPFVLALAGMPYPGRSSDTKSRPTRLTEEALQVPLMIYHSRQNSGRRTESPCALLDLLPTLADSSHSARVPRHDGTSLVAWMDARQNESPTNRVFRWCDPLNADRVAVRQGPWKAVFDGTGQLYYLPQDPQEQRNVASENPDIMKTLAKLGQVEL